MAAAKQVEKHVEKKPLKAEKKIQKEKKPKVVKEKKATVTKPATAAHPSYFEMIKEALVALNERTGSSPHAIAKYMEEKHKSALPANFRKALGLQLKNSVAKEKLVKIKASFKLADSEKKAKPVAKKPAKAKAAVPKKVKKILSPKKKTVLGVKKTTPMKKKAPSAIKAKKPKSIKSSVAKKGRKVAAV